MNYRLYTFVANHYISPLQCGLQTAHVVSELSQFKTNTPQWQKFNAWAFNDKTIIICGAGNHAGVVSCFAELDRLCAQLGLPVAIFREDEQSMNGMATACGVIVPEKYWNVTWVANPLYIGGGYWQHAKVENPLSPSDYDDYVTNDTEGQFISHIKGYRLA